MRVRLASWWLLGSRALFARGAGEQVRLALRVRAFIYADDVCAASIAAKAFLAAAARLSCSTAWRLARSVHIDSAMASPLRS